MANTHSPHIPQAHQHGAGLVPAEIAVGVMLAAIGLVTAVTFVAPGFGAYAALVIGLVLVVLFALTREYGFAVPAGIVTGAGVATALATVLPEEAMAPAFMFALAAGFVGVWVLGLLAIPSTSHAWPFVPAAVVAVIGVLLATGREDSLVYVQLLTAVIFVVAGIWIVARYLRRTT
jgi:hypothetical protein